MSFTAEGKKQNVRIGASLRENGYEVLQEHFGTEGRKTAAEERRSETEAAECGEGTGVRSEENSWNEDVNSFAVKKNTEEFRVETEKMSAKDFVSRVFPQARLLIFVGACSIAVRMIAPHVRDKKTDPAVLAVDERGQFVIPLLSGHLGGANLYARQIADEIGATPVITTATDIEGRFAPDLFAGKYHLKIRSMEDAKAVAAAGLSRDVKIYIAVPWEGEMPAERGAYCAGGCAGNRENAPAREKKQGSLDTWEEKKQESAENREKKQESDGWCAGREKYEDEKPGPPCVLVTNEEKPQIMGSPQCTLTPQNLIVGIGCRRGTGAEKIISFVRELFPERNLSTEAILCFASVDLKKDEAGILETAETFGVPYDTYSAELLNTLRGEFTASEFVKSHTGTDNVCERSAAMAGVLWHLKRTGKKEDVNNTGRTGKEGTVNDIERTKKEGAVNNTEQTEKEEGVNTVEQVKTLSDGGNQVWEAEHGRFLVRKQAKDGITLAVYEVSTNFS